MKLCNLNANFLIIPFKFFYIFPVDGSGGEDEDDYSSEVSSEFTGGSDFDDEEGKVDLQKNDFLYFSQ